MNQSQSLPWWQQKRVQYTAIAGLVSLMLFVVFVLPDLVTPVSLEEAERKAGVDTAPVEIKAPSESPFADAQLARERKQAQEILSKLVQLQDQLEGQRVRDWAGTAYQAALDTAARGDEYYRQRAFTEAQDNYRNAQGQLESLQAQADEILTQQLALGQAALQDKNASAATEAFTVALAIAPDNAEAQQGLASAGVLDQVLDLMRKARQAEKTDHWDQALDLYRQAQALDPRSSLARDARADLEQKIQTRDFNQAMSEGFRQLDRGNFDAARKSFNAAGKIRPNDDSVTLALQQVANQSTLSSIQSRLNRAGRAEQEERWIDANNLYKSVLETDPTVVDALVGKLRTDARAELEQRTLDLIANPLSFNKPEQMARAEQTLAELQKLGDGGAQLQQQREQLAQLIASAKRPRQVIFRSDNLTQVTVYHVGKLGAFAEHAVTLPPGNYVAVGSRQGYRDVREEFTVALDANQVIVNVRCTEKVALGD